MVLRLARSLPPLGSVMPMAVDQLAGAEPRQPALALLGRGQLDQVRRHDVGVDAQARRERGRGAGQLLADDDDEAPVDDARAAVLLRDAQAEQALLAGLDPQVTREGLGGA